MKQLQTVDPTYVHQLWSDIKPFFEASFVNSTGDCTPDQLRLLLSKGAQHLFVITDEGKICGAFAVEIVNHPNSKSATTTAMGGRGLFTKETVAQYEDWARAQGVTKIRAFAREAQARLFKQKLGLISTAYVVEKTL